MLHDAIGCSGTEMPVPLAFLVDDYMQINNMLVKCPPWGRLAACDRLDPSTPLTLVHRCRDSSCYKYVLLVYASKAHQLVFLSSEFRVRDWN